MDEAARAPGTVLVTAATAGFLFVAPLAFDPWGVQGFLHVKLAVLGAAVLAGTAAAARRGWRLPASRWALRAAAALLAVLTVAALAAEAPAEALLGSATRQLGVLAWSLHATAFLLGVQLRDREAGWPAEPGVWLAAGVTGAGLVGVAEIAGVEWLQENAAFGARVVASLGNPAFFAAFLVLAIPAVTGVAIARGSSVAGAVAMGGAVMLVATGTRGAWVALALAGAVALVARRALPHPARRWVAATVVIVLALGVGTAVTGRWATIDQAVAGRIDLWAVGVDVVAAHPVLGVGPEGFDSAFAAHVDEGFVAEYSRDQVYDRAHNGLLDVAVSGGLAAAAVYAAIMAGVAWTVWRAMRVADAATVGLAIGVGAYFAQQQVFFQLAVLDAVAWFAVGVVAARVWAPAAARASRGWTAAAALVGVVVLGYALAGLTADHLDRRAIDRGDDSTALHALRTAQRLRPIDNVHAVLAGSLFRESRDPALVAGGLDLVRAARRWLPDDGLLRTSELNLLLQSYRLRRDVAGLDEAETLVRALLDDDPTNGDAYLKLGTVALLRGDQAAARDHWLRAQALLPGNRTPAENLAALQNPAGARDGDAPVSDERGRVGAGAAQLLSAHGSVLGAYGDRGWESIAPEFAAEVERRLLADPALGSTADERRARLLTGGLTVRTTLREDMLAAAERVLRGFIPERDGPDAAVLTIDRATGQVLVMAGLDQDRRRRGLAVLAQAGRPTGSAFKAVALAAALEAGFTPDSPIPAPPCVTVHDVDGAVVETCGGSGGTETLTTATVDSINVAYVELTRVLGPGAVTGLARELGVDRSPLLPVDSVALGTNPVTMIELAAAFDALANGGAARQPAVVLEVADASGVLRVAAPPPARRVVRPETATAVDRILELVVAEGTGAAAQLGTRTAGKTGTGLALTDAWFVGYDDRYLTAVWVGFSDEPDQRLVPPAVRDTVVGGSWPAQIWREVTLAYP